VLAGGNVSGKEARHDHNKTALHQIGIDFHSSPFMLKGNTLAVVEGARQQFWVPTFPFF